jgi:hypothetical protein
MLRTLAAAISLLFLGSFASALAKDASVGPPSGAVTIRQVQVAFLGSGALGGGTLKFRGRAYPITVGGLGVGGIGASTLTAQGSVYGLTRAQDFPGAYVQLRTGWALADQGKGTLWLRNANGVTMKLKAKREGLQLGLGADGVIIGFK